MASNVFSTITCPQTGTGAATATTTLGPKKTITISGNFTSPVVIEASEDAVTYAPVLIVEPPAGEPKTYDVSFVAAAMRASRPYFDSNQPTITVSAQGYNGNVFATLAVPASTGTGAATVTTTMGDLKSITVTGAPYSGDLIVEGSADGGTTWDPVAKFSELVADGQHDVRTISGTYNAMRVRRFGCKGANPGTPVVAVGGALSDPGTGTYDANEILYGAADGSGAISQDNEFVWLESTNKLGVGTASPTANLSVVTPSLTVQQNVLDLTSTWYNASGAFKGILGRFEVATAASGALMMDLRSVTKPPTEYSPAATMVGRVTIDAITGRMKVGENANAGGLGLVDIIPHEPGLGGGAIIGRYGANDVYFRLASFYAGVQGFPGLELRDPGDVPYRGFYGVGASAGLHLFAGATANPAIQPAQLTIKGKGGSRGSIVQDVQWNNAVSVDTALAVNITEVASPSFADAVNVAFGARTALNVRKNANASYTVANNTIGLDRATIGLPQPLYLDAALGIAAGGRNYQDAIMSLAYDRASGGAGLTLAAPGNSNANAWFAGIGLRGHTSTTQDGSTIVFTTSTVKATDQTQASMAERMQITATGNIGLFSSSNTAPVYYGAGIGTVYLGNATSMPTTNPTGGVFIFATGGGLLARGANGTIQVLCAP